MDWRPGNKLVHPFNPELGVGVVVRVEGRFLDVLFPDCAEQRRFSTDGSGLKRHVLRPGERLELTETREIAVVEAVRGHFYLLTDGRTVPDALTWPVGGEDTLVNRLIRGDTDPCAAFAQRAEGLRLQAVREAGGLGSFLGGRIQIFPHQLHTALAAARSDPVRWLLADDVGLGKTVVACLVLSALVRTGRVKRALVVAPSHLVLQWLGELYRKFHQVFVLLDEERLDSVGRDFGEEVNPFDVHPFAVIANEQLTARPGLVTLAKESGLGIVVADEAHCLVRSSPPEPALTLAGLAEHALLLTATPLRADHRGFFELLRCLHPDDFKELDRFEQAIAAEEAVLPCTSAVRRSQIGDLPPREPCPIDVGPVTASLYDDPRSDWLVEHARLWLEAGEKAVVFARDVETVKQLKQVIESRTHLGVFVFHEEQRLEDRDVELARFRVSKAPILLSSEVGGEGRNFQFCARMVHFDLPLHPSRLEQRIGRLDRIGRDRPVEICYFRHPDGGDLDLARLYERLELFSRPSGGLDDTLTVVAAELSGGGGADLDGIASRVEEARARLDGDLSAVFYRDAYDGSTAEALLAQVPEGLDEGMERFCIGAAEQLGLRVLEKPGARRYYIEVGAGAQVDRLSGIAPDARFLGTFDRAEGVAAEELDFFSNGHPLVEALFCELEDGDRGSVTALELPPDVALSAGAIGLFKSKGSWTAEVVDLHGRARPEWTSELLEALPRCRDLDVASFGADSTWSTRVRTMVAELERHGRLVALAFFVSGGAG